MTTPEQCEAIFQKIQELTDKDESVAFTRDWGGNSLTVYVGKNHTHVGLEDGTFEDMIDGLHNVLHGGPGLSWADAGPPPNEEDII